MIPIFGSAFFSEKGAPTVIFSALQEEMPSFLFV